MRTVEEIIENARPGRAFYGAIPGERWQERWCDRCKYDTIAQPDPDIAGCPILLVALAHDLTPAEWIEPGPAGVDYVCTEFDDDA